VTLRVAAIEGDEDHDATWLLGHTEQIDFGSPFERDGELWCQASLHVPCRFLNSTADGRVASCNAYGYQGKVLPPRRAAAARRLGRDRFNIVDNHKLVARKLDPPAEPRRSLPMLSVNPCAGTPCRTSDNRRGDACCRDIQVDICCTTKQTRLEALIRSRKSPYLCKVVREEDHSVVVEMISACGFLKENGGCDLHGRQRADGRPAKPAMCSHWPDRRSGLHPGCAFKSRKVPL
jgi:hypothetical protein